MTTKQKIGATVITLFFIAIYGLAGSSDVKTLNDIHVTNLTN